jgi:hypothetical protein
MTRPAPTSGLTRRENQDRRRPKVAVLDNQARVCNNDRSPLRASKIGQRHAV